VSHNVRFERRLSTLSELHLEMERREMENKRERESETEKNWNIHIHEHISDVRLKKIGFCSFLSIDDGK
jgi:hypothetical protein